jgi:hypothetical protein
VNNLERHALGMLAFSFDRDAVDAERAEQQWKEDGNTYEQGHAAGRRTAFEQAKGRLHALVAAAEQDKIDQELTR